MFSPVRLDNQLFLTEVVCIDRLFEVDHVIHQGAGCGDHCENL